MFFTVSHAPLTSDWEVFTRLDRSQYYLKTSAADDSSEHRTVVGCLRTEAADTVQSWSLSFEEVYFLRKDQCLLVFRSSQTAVHASHQYIHFKTKQKLSWHYIAAHPAHAGKFMADWIPEAHEQALVFTLVFIRCAGYRIFNIVPNFIFRGNDFIDSPDCIPSKA
jgi:hypothetical protein